jgi:hypothetical protein
MQYDEVVREELNCFARGARHTNLGPRMGHHRGGVAGGLHSVTIW